MPNTAVQQDEWIKDTTTPEPAMNELLASRKSLYGPFRGQAEVAQNIKDAMKISTNWDSLEPYQKEGLEMVAHKIARMLNGSSLYEDNLVDIIGYTQRILECTREDNGAEA